MVYLIVKAILTGLIVVVISEVAKRSSLFGAVIASLPLTTILAMIWLYIDTGNIEATTKLTQGILWVILPSLVFFVLFPILVKVGASFFLALGGSALLTGAFYWIYILVLKENGINL